MDIKAKKLSLIEWLLNLQDERIIRQIESIKAGIDFWDELNEAEKADIEKGLDDLEKGNFHSYESIVDAHRKK